MGEPDVAAYYAVVPHRSAPQNGGSGVNNHVAADVGVTFYSLDGISLFVKLKASCP